MKATEIREFVLANIPFMPPGWKASSGLRGAINGGIGKALRGAKNDCPKSVLEVQAYRHMILAYLFSPGQTAISSNDLTEEQWYALYKWYDPWEELGVGWHHRVEFDRECNIILAQAKALDLERMGQLNFLEGSS